MSSQDQGIKTEPTSAELVALFRFATRAMARAFHQHGRFQHAQAHVLSLVGQRGTITQRELMEMMHVRSASLSEVLGKLERNGLINKKRSQEDRRGFVLELTEAGRAAHHQFEADREDNAEALLGCLDGTEREQMAAILKKIIATLKDDFADQEEDEKHHGRHSHGPFACKEQDGHASHGRRGGPGRGSRPHGRNLDHDEGNVR